MVDLPESAVTLFAILIAPGLGSVARLAADRSRVHEGNLYLLFPPSKCDHCGKQLEWQCVIPIASWFVLRGQSRCCGLPISSKHLWVESACLVLAIWAATEVTTALLLPTVLLGAVLLGLAMIDLVSFRLPDAGTLGLVAMGLGLSLASVTGPPAEHALAAVVGFGVFWIIGELYYRLRGREALGLGDAKLLAAAGAWCGLAALPSVVLIGAIIGLAHAALLAFRGNAVGAQSALPFGPGLAVGFWLTWLYGPLVLR
ncbi:MAG: A24 family peptidase [Pseudomonadota bacterium]